MTPVDSDALPRIVFFNINGSGMGHLSRCLAYARRMKGRARPIFFSLASAIEIIEEMGFEADYFVSHFWSASHINAWNRELAVRFRLMLEEVQPHAVVFDGTWPYHGFMDACDIHGVRARVWSNRGLHKKNFGPVPVKETAFDLVVRPGELGNKFSIEREGPRGRTINTPPVTLFDDEELLDRATARQALGLDPDKRYALFSLGPGNLKEIGDFAFPLLELVRQAGYDAVWAKAPISVRDVLLPASVRTISVFPLVRYMRAFDLFAGASGYNTCCEVVQAGIPSLLVPNAMVADDQMRRARMVADVAPVVVSSCDSETECEQAIIQLLGLAGNGPSVHSIDLSGATLAANEILQLLET